LLRAVLVDLFDDDDEDEEYPMRWAVVDTSWDSREVTLAAKGA